MNTDHIDFARRELSLAADRARDHGVTPSEFLAALVTFATDFTADYTDTNHTAADVAAAFTDDHTGDDH